MDEMIFNGNEIIYHVDKNVKEEEVAKSVPGPFLISCRSSELKLEKYRFVGFRECKHEKFMKTDKEAVYRK